MKSTRRHGPGWASRSPGLLLVALGLLPADLRAADPIDPWAGLSGVEAGEKPIGGLELSGQPPIFGQGRPDGPLTGKTVYLSPGHGWYYNTTYGWLTQRGNNNGIVEDFENNETISQYVVRYLENAGADVWTCRDRCFSTVEIVMDNADPGYGETGSWANISGWSGTGRYAIASSTETATATFTPDIPADGYFPLYIYFVIGTDRVPDALVRVNHSGGSTEIRVNQRLTRSNWRYVGTFYWFAGTGQSVTISNQSSVPGNIVIADAIRIGGGVGDQPPTTGGGGPSGKRRADECSVYWARYQGAPSSVYNPTTSGDGTDDVTCRPKYAEWEHEDGEHAVFVSLHSNAGGGGTAHGTETYAYSDGTPAGSLALRNLIQAEIVADLRAEWDPGWVDRGTKTANFGELRELVVIPGCLVEIGFHDNPDEADDLLQPEFRRIAARAIYQAIAKYFGGGNVPLLPEPPTAVSARSLGSPTSIEVDWDAPAPSPAGGDAPTKYKVYKSPNGFAFDNGTETTDTRLSLPGLEPGSLWFFRVTALNSGGESFPTPVVACKTPLQGEADEPLVLVVDGYDRLDRFMNLLVYESGALGVVDRQFLDRRMNSFDYMIEHATALAGTSFSPAFDSAVNEAVISGHVALTDYLMVDWYVGRESTADETFSTSEQSLVSSFLNTGGRLLVSGEDIGWDLDHHGNTSDRAFYNNMLRADYVSDDAGVYAAYGAAGSLFDGIGTVNFDDGTHGTYNATYADVITPYAGSTVAMSYASGGTAAIAYEGPTQVVMLAFPLETVYDTLVRTDVMERVIAQFDLEGGRRTYGDFDDDGDADMEDFGMLQACLSGPFESVIDPGCFPMFADANDDHIDQEEINLFLACKTGANVPVDPACDD